MPIKLSSNSFNLYEPMYASQLLADTEKILKANIISRIRTQINQKPPQSPQEVYEKVCADKDIDAILDCLIFIKRLKEDFIRNGGPTNVN